MSIDTTMFELEKLLTGLTANGTSLERVIVGLPEQIAAGDLPLAVIALAPNVKNTSLALAMGHARLNYTIRIWLILAMRNSTMPAIYGLQNPWAEAIARTLWNHLQLESTVTMLGRDGEDLLTWRFEPALQWGDGLWMALVFDVSVAETPITPMNP